MTILTPSVAQNRQVKTFRDLFNAMRFMSEEQLDCDLTIRYGGVFDEPEYYVAQLFFTKEDDILDKNHPYFDTYWGKEDETL